MQSSVFRLIMKPGGRLEAVIFSPPANLFPEKGGL